MTVRGTDARNWLQGQVSQDLAALTVGQSAETLVLSPQGKVDVYCRATMLGDEVVLLDTETGYGQALSERLRRFHLRVKADLEIGVVRCLELRGPASATAIHSSELEPEKLVASVSNATLRDRWVVAVAVEWPGYHGFDVLTTAEGPDWPLSGVAMGDPAAFETARIEAGVPAMGRELTDKTIPQEAGRLVEHTVSFTKGCYTGQELVARLDARGGNVAWRLRGVVLDPACGPSEDSTLSISGREVGHLTSTAWSPRFVAPVGLAYVRRDVTAPAGAVVIPGGCRAEIRELPL